MKFLVNMMNHSAMGQRSLEDVIGILGHQLRALGHEIVWEQSNTQFLTNGAGYNVIVEGTTDEFVRIVADAHGKGARFLCIATEEPTPKGFNWGTSKEMAQRQWDFPKIAPYLDGILTLVPGQHVLDWYSQHAPTAPAELGYAPTLVRGTVVRQMLDAPRSNFLGASAEPRYDFGFYGSISKRRMRLLKKLAQATGKRDAVRVVGDFATQDERDAAMLEAKVIVQIRKFDEMGLVSSSRCCTALCLGRPVVAEPHELSKPWDEVVRFAKTDSEFISLALMARGAWRGMHALQFDRFKAKLSPEYCVGRALHALNVESLRRAA